jgi:Protein of unknown function (DUF3168)
MLVDVEALAGNVLRADAGVTALAGDGVSPELPPALDDELPYLQLWRLPGATITDETQHLERARLQFAAWAANRADALDLARAACSALRDFPGVHTEGIVTAVDLETTPYWSPDPDTDTPRYLWTAALFVHP